MFLLYTPANSGLFGWSARAPNVYPSQLWFVGVVSQGFYCIPQPHLVHWGDQPGLLVYAQNKIGSLGWSARVSLVYLSRVWLLIYLFGIMIQVDWTNHTAKKLKKKQEKTKKFFFLKIWKTHFKIQNFKKSQPEFFSFSHVLSFLFHDLTHWTNRTAEKLKKEIKRLKKTP